MSDGRKAFIRVLQQETDKLRSELMLLPPRRKRLSSPTLMHLEYEKRQKAVPKMFLDLEPDRSTIALLCA